MESKKKNGTPQKTFSEGGGRKKRRGQDAPRGPRSSGSNPSAPVTSGAPPSPSQGRSPNPPPGNRRPPQGAPKQDGSPPAQARDRGRPPQPRRDRSKPGAKDQGRNQGNRGSSSGKSNQPQQNLRDNQEAELRQQAAARLAAIEAEDRLFRHIPRLYGIVIFETLAHAHHDLELVKEKAALVDQLNVIIRAEANMDDPVLTAIPKVKVFAGAAWALIHDRRIADGWYEAPR